MSTKAKVLIVDDEEANLLALEGVLEPLALSIIRARSGQEALRCLLKDDFALILLDVHMPEVDGLETATLIRQRGRSSHTPIIFLTVAADSSQISRGYAIGAADYLIKPFNAEILRSKVSVFVGLYEMTDKLKAQEESLRGLNAILENAVEGISRLDSKRKYLAVNNAFASLVGFELHELVGQPWETTIHKDDRNLLLAAYQQMLSEGKSEAEARAIRKDGQVRYQQMVLIKDSDKDKKFAGFYCFVKDVTEQKHWQARSQLANIVESSNDAIVLTNLAGRITAWNPAAERIFGYKGAEIIGCPSTMLVPPDRADELTWVFSQLEKGQRVQPFETVALGRKGRLIDISTSVSAVRDAAGNLTGASFIARDITDHKRLERELREKNAELEHAIATKDRFLATISHELRTPLNAIIGFTGILLMKLSGPLTEKQERQLQSIEASAQHLHMLINDLLDLSRIESGKVKLNFEQISLKAVVEEVAGALRPLADKKGLEFAVHGLDSEATVTTDQRSLKQILINLISNAIKFTPEGCIFLDINRRDEGGGLVTEFAVTDTGIGIKEEDREKLFKPFEQVDESKLSEGTGLGLYLSKKLSQLLGGSIEVESEFQRGSKFTLVIPQVPRGGNGDHSDY